VNGIAVSNRRFEGTGDPIIMDGLVLATERAPALAARAARVLSDRGRPPELLLVAFQDADGTTPYVDRKVRACAQQGVRVVPLTLPEDTDTAAAVAAIETAAVGAPDAVFVEFPFPRGLDGDAVVAAIPPALDVDVMTAQRIDSFTNHDDSPAPLTVAAALALVDRYGIDIAERCAIVIGEESPFSRMFRLAFMRRGVGRCALVSPDSADLAPAAGQAALAIVIAGRRHLLPSSAFPAGAVVIDGGYFNPGGSGDVDPAPGIRHLAAFAPVPGAIGPMTVSMLVERTIEFAEMRGV
jgi:methylenetetrahydrofolate dehydrogenase (NADP+)/methenyltetrahydrofolate cyclohydrolase